MTSQTVNDRRRAQVIRGVDAERTKDALDSGVLTAFDPRTTVVTLTPLEAAEAAKRAAFEQGYSDGLEAARAAVEAATEDANRRVRRALHALVASVDMFDAREATALADVEDAVAAAACDIAETILGRELATAQQPGADAIARALQLAPGRNDVVARLHPSDVETLSMDRINTAGRCVTVVADAAIEPGGCVLECGVTDVDAQIGAALRRVREVLVGATGNASSTSWTTSSEAPKP